MTQKMEQFTPLPLLSDEQKYIISSKLSQKIINEAMNILVIREKQNKLLRPNQTDDVTTNVINQALDLMKNARFVKLHSQKNIAKISPSNNPLSNSQFSDEGSFKTQLSGSQALSGQNQSIKVLKKRNSSSKYSKNTRPIRKTVRGNHKKREQIKTVGVSKSLKFESESQLKLLTTEKQIFESFSLGDDSSRLDETIMRELYEFKMPQ